MSSTLVNLRFNYVRVYTNRPQRRDEHDSNEQHKTRKRKCGNEGWRSATYDRFVEAAGDLVATIRGAFIQIVAIKGRSRGAGTPEAHVVAHAGIEIVTRGALVDGRALAGAGGFVTNTGVTLVDAG